MQCHVVLHICMQNSRVMLPDFATSKRVKNATVYDVWMAVTETECTDLRDNPSKPSTVGGVRDCLYKILGDWRVHADNLCLCFAFSKLQNHCMSDLHFLLWCLSCNSAFIACTPDTLRFSRVFSGLFSDISWVAHFTRDQYHTRAPTEVRLWTSGTHHAPLLIHIPHNIVLRKPWRLDHLVDSSAVTAAAVTGRHLHPQPFSPHL
jgi:hypothetical protein